MLPSVLREGSGRINSQLVLIVVLDFRQHLAAT